MLELDIVPSDVSVQNASDVFVQNSGQTTPDADGETASVPIVSQDFGGDGSSDSFGADSEGDSNSSQMPDMIDLEASGLKRLPRIAVQKPKNYFKSMLTMFCAFGMVVGSALADPVPVFSHGQACVNAAVHECHTINANFDKSLNHLHHMALAAGQTDNEVYTFN